MSSWYPIDEAPKDGTWVLVGMVDEMDAWLEPKVSAAFWADYEWLASESGQRLPFTPTHFAKLEYIPIVPSQKAENPPISYNNTILRYRS